jgi:hypothetical protein
LAHDEGELRLLVEEAHRLLADDQQGVLDLGITPAAPKATMVGPSTQAGLFASTPAAPPAPQLVGRPRVLKTSSQLLNDALAEVYSGLGFDSLGSFSILCPVRGVMVSMIWPSVKASPCQRKWDSRSLGALVTREPTMNRRSASSSSRRFVADSIPTSATMTMSARPCRA